MQVRCLFIIRQVLQWSANGRNFPNNNLSIPFMVDTVSYSVWSVENISQKRLRMRRQRHTHLFTWATLYHFTLFYQRSLFWDCHSFYMKSSGTPWYRFYGDRPSLVRFMTVVFRLWDFVREGGSCHIGPTCSLVGGSPEVWYTVINRLSRRVPLDRHDWFPWSAEPVRYGTAPSCQLNQWDPPAPRGAQAHNAIPMHVLDLGHLTNHRHIEISWIVYVLWQNIL